MMIQLMGVVEKKGVVVDGNKKPVFESFGNFFFFLLFPK